MKASKRVPMAAIPRDGGPAPVRKVVRRSAARMTSWHPSMKMGCLVGCESKDELLHVLRMEADGTIARFYSQPEVLQWEKDGRMRRHVPDFRVELEDGSIEIHEVKRTGALRSMSEADFAERTEHFRAELVSSGILYRVIDEVELDRQPRLANAHRMWAARHARPTDRLARRATALVAYTEAKTVGELLAAMPDAKEADVLALGLRRILVLDIESTPLSSKTRIRLPRRLSGKLA
jgi:hypothetical protein